MAITGLVLVKEALVIAANQAMIVVRIV